MQPLSYILRPKSIKDIVGQSHLFSKTGIIAKIVEKKFVINLIFYGPPGIGKTTTAIALANDLNMNYEQFNASKDKKEKLQDIIKKNSNNKLILVIDEIHRMNRNIQDFLLQFLEKKEIIIFITTTENPYFVINPAIRSRCTILQLKEISIKEMVEGLKKIIKKNDLNINIEDSMLIKLCELSNGDLRIALNALEILMNLYEDEKITAETLANIFDRAYIKGSGVGDEYYDLQSAFQKSIRGSDIDAALHYFARIVEIGDFEQLMRRMIVTAYEDISLANPAMGPRVFQACQAFRQIGMPIGSLILGTAVIEMALSEKSNSTYLAIESALSDVRNGKISAVPTHLKDTNYKSVTKLGADSGYKYPHDFENSWVEQQYLPDILKNKKYFHFKNNSIYEKKLKEIYDKFIKK